jgi:predicted nucleotidyltransferase
MAEDPPSVPDTFRRIVGFLEAEKVPFVVVGGIAAGLQGEPRGTQDVDLMVTYPSSRVYRLAQKANEAGWHIDPEQAETQWRFSGFVRFWLGPKGKQVAADLMACNSDFLREVAWRAQPARFCGVRVPIATAEDMVIFKLAAWREKDLPAIRAILARRRQDLDLTYVRKWVMWFAVKHATFREMPERLAALLEGRPLPPLVRWPSP